MKSELCYPSQDPHYSDSIQMILNYLLITWLIQEACSSIASRKFKETYQKKKKKKTSFGFLKGKNIQVQGPLIKTIKLFYCPLP